MEKLFDDTLFVQKERPTKITKQQEEKMWLDLARECIKNQYSNDDEETISKDLKKLSSHDSGFEKAKDLEDNGRAYYEFAELKEYPHGLMVGIYDEKPKNNHIDYISPERLLKVYPCNKCQGGGCLDCGGFGKFPM